MLLFITDSTFGPEGLQSSKNITAKIILMTAIRKSKNQKCLLHTPQETQVYVLKMNHYD